MINKPLNKIDKGDLEDLIKNSVSEGKQIEYKEGLPGTSPSDRREFLADISSFANTIGGDLLFGIEEEKGVPTKIKGIEIKDIDQQKLQLENMIRDGIEPRIIYTIQPIVLSDKKTVLVIRVNQSWIGPHRVIFQGHDKFYARNSSGKYPVDTIELRTAFNLSDTLVDKIKKFYTQRIMDLMANKTPIPFYEGGKIILHLIPLSAFNPGIKYSFEPYHTNPAKLAPMRSSGWNTRYNLEGFVSYSGGQEGKTHSYTQLYRNGIIEAVEGLTLMRDRGPLYISHRYEGMLLNYIQELFAVMQELQVSTPLYIFISLTDVKGFKIVPDKSKFLFFDENDHFPIDRNILILPEVLIENYGINLISTLKSTFDLVWNACGYEWSWNYDKNGAWIG